MIPLEDFFRKPDRTMLRLSPGGGHLSWMAPWERRLNVFVQDLATGGVTRVTSHAERDVGGYMWASDERLIYLRDSGGDENYRLHAVGRDGSNPLDLTPFDGVKCGIVDELEDDDAHILFQMNRRNPEVFDVYRLDVNTGEMQRIAENAGNVQSWHTDHEGRLRLAVTTDGVNTSPRPGARSRPTTSRSTRARACSRSTIVRCTCRRTSGATRRPCSNTTRRPGVRGG
jgi:hypothetical protein